MTWPTFPLRELGSVFTGSTPRTTETQFFGGDIPFVTPSDLDGEGPILTTPRTLSEKGLQEARELPEDAILVCCIGSLGKIGIAGRNLATNQQINSIVFDANRVFPRFGLHAVRRLKPILELMAPATTLAIVSKKKFENLEIPVPPIREQRRVAEILDRAEALCQLRDKTVQLLYNLEVASFVEIFGSMGQGETSWPLVPFGELVRETTLGLVRSSAELGDDLPVPYVRMNAIRRDGSLDLSGVDRTNASASEIERYSLLGGDFLFNTRNSRELVGKSAVFYSGELYIFNNNIMRIRFKKGIYPRFVAQTFRMPIITNAIELCKAGTTSVFAIYWKALKNILVPLPPEPLQRRFSEIADGIERQRQRLSVLISTES